MKKLLLALRFRETFSASNPVTFLRTIFCFFMRLNYFKMFFTDWANFYNFRFKPVMKLLMFACIRKIHKVFNAVVISNPISMVNSLFRKKIPSKMFFHYKTMLSNVWSTSAKRMIRFVNQNISPLVLKLTTLPRRVFLTFKKLSIKVIVLPRHFRAFFVFVPRSRAFFKDLRITTKRTIFSYIPIRGNIKSFATSFTSFFKPNASIGIANLPFLFRRHFLSFFHNNLRNIKKALFGELMRLRLSSLRLLSALSLHKKFATSLTILIITFSMGICQVNNAYSADQWDTTDPAGDENISDLDSLITTNNDVLDRLLADYRQGVNLEYSSGSELTVTSGQVVCENSDGSTRKWRENTSSSTLDFTDLDTGSENNSTTYYVYAVADTDATTFTFLISNSSSSPSGATYYRRLGTFYNNSSSNIDYDSVRNDGFYTTKLGDWESKSSDTTYQADTDGSVVGYGQLGSNWGGMNGYSDSSNPPTVKRTRWQLSDDLGATLTMPVKKGDYWKVTASAGSYTVYWIPSEISD